MKIMPVHPLLKLSGKIILAVSGCLLLIAGSASLFLYFNSDRIKSYLVNELNRQLNAKVEVKNITFSPWKRFPHTTLWFQEVTVSPNKENTLHQGEPLLHADQLHLVFDLSDIIRKKYNLKRVHISEGFLNIHIYENGSNNYTLWKTPADGQDKSFSIDLRDVELRNMELSYAQHPGKIHLKGYSRRTSLRGNFTEKGMKISGRSETTLLYLLIHNLESETAMEHKLAFAIEKHDEQLDFSLTELKTGGLSFYGTGNISTGEKKEMDFSIHGEKLDIRNIVENIPARYRERLRIPKSSGQLDINATIKGPVSGNMVPHIEVIFSMTGAEIVFRDIPHRISNINCQGLFTNGPDNHLRSSRLELTSFSASYGSGSVKGKAGVTNFTKPVIKGEWTGDLKLEEIKYLLPEINRPEMSGFLRSNISFSMMPAGFPAISLNDFAGAGVQGHLSLKGLNLLLPAKGYRLSDIDGDLLFSDRLWFDNLSLYINGVPFVVSGQADNLMPGLFGKTVPVAVQADAYSPHLNMDTLLQIRRTQDTSEKKPAAWPSGITAELRVRADTFNMKNFSALNATGMISYEPGMLIYPSLEFQTMQGKVSANGMLWQQASGDIYTHTRTELSSVDIKELFAVFNDFGQQFIQTRHLEGKLSGHLMVKTGFDNLWKTEKESLVAEAGIVIEQGELIGFEPMMHLSRFIELEELEHIRFSRLENNILIHDQEVIVPRMDINSSAFNISVTGRHAFTNQFRYHLRVYLSDILAGKVKRAKKDDVEFGMVEEDGLNRSSIYLRIEGTPENYIISYDREAVREVIRQGFRDQGSEIRKILNEEFGMFKKDSTPPESTFVRPFRIRWEEEPLKEDSLPIKEEKIKKSPLFRIRWEEEKEDSTETGRNGRLTD